MRRWFAVLALGLVGLAVSGCGSSSSDSSDDASGASDSKADRTSESDGSDKPAAAGDDSEAAEKPVPRKPPPTKFADTKVHVASSAHAKLTGFEVDKGDGVETLTFTFSDTDVLPEYHVDYVDAVRSHPADDPIEVEGSAFLEVGFQFTDPNSKGRLAVSPDSYPDQPVVKQTLLVRNVGGELRFAIGLDHKAKFRATEDSNRLVVEIRAT